MSRVIQHPNTPIKWHPQRASSLRLPISVLAAAKQSGFALSRILLFVPALLFFALFGLIASALFAFVSENARD